MFLLIYGFNIKNRKQCVICGNETHCLINTCKPVGFEGYLLYYYILIIYGK